MELMAVMTIYNKCNRDSRSGEKCKEVKPSINQHIPQALHIINLSSNMYQGWVTNIELATGVANFLCLLLVNGGHYIKLKP